MKKMVKCCSLSCCLLGFNWFIGPFYMLSRKIHLVTRRYLSLLNAQFLLMQLWCQNQFKYWNNLWVVDERAEGLIYDCLEVDFSFKVEPSLTTSLCCSLQCCCLNSCKHLMHKNDMRRWTTWPLPKMGGEPLLTDILASFLCHGRKRPHVVHLWCD